MTTVARKYALTKIDPGDYLLPSNDATVLYRIRKYTDGPSLASTGNATEPCGESGAGITASPTWNTRRPTRTTGTNGCTAKTGS